MCIFVKCCRLARLVASRSFTMTVIRCRRRCFSYFCFLLILISSFHFSLITLKMWERWDVTMSSGKASQSCNIASNGRSIRVCDDDRRIERYFGNYLRERKAVLKEEQNGLVATAKRQTPAMVYYNDSGRIRWNRLNRVNRYPSARVCGGCAYFVYDSKIKSTNRFFPNRIEICQLSVDHVPCVSIGLSECLNILHLTRTNILLNGQRVSWLWNRYLNMN